MPKEDLDQKIEQWASMMNASPSVRVEVYRVEPKVWEGRSVAGKLTDYDDLPSWEDLRDVHGGGKYRLLIKRPDPCGRLVYYGCKTVKIAGDPLVSCKAPLAFNEKERDQVVRVLAASVVEELLEERIAALERQVARLRQKLRR